MARLLGRIWSGGHYCSGTPEFRQRAKRAEQRAASAEIASETPPQPCEGCGTLTLDWRDNGWFCSDECVQLWIGVLLDQPEFRDADEYRKELGRRASTGTG